MLIDLENLPKKNDPGGSFKCAPGSTPCDYNIDPVFTSQSCIRFRRTLLVRFRANIWWPKCFNVILFNTVGIKLVVGIIFENLRLRIIFMKSCNVFSQSFDRLAFLV